MMQILTTIALWCSTPTYSRLSSYDVNKCRDDFFKCIDNDKRDRLTSLETKVYDCAKTIKL